MFVNHVGLKENEPVQIARKASRRHAPIALQETTAVWCDMVMMTSQDGPDAPPALPLELLVSARFADEIRGVCAIPRLSRNKCISGHFQPLTRADICPHGAYLLTQNKHISASGQSNSARTVLWVSALFKC